MIDTIKLRIDLKNKRVEVTEIDQDFVVKKNQELSKFLCDAGKENRRFSTRHFKKKYENEKKAFERLKQKNDEVISDKNKFIHNLKKRIQELEEENENLSKNFDHNFSILQSYETALLKINGITFENLD